MKLSQILLATFAAVAMAAPNPEANSAEVDARDVPELDTRMPDYDMEELIARESADLEARTFHWKKCGWGAYYKHGSCYCHLKNYSYEHGKCQKKCHHGAYYEHGQCKCEHHGYYYDHEHGCRKNKHY